MELDKMTVEELARQFASLAAQYYDDHERMEYGNREGERGYDSQIWVAIYFDCWAEKTTFEAAVGFMESALEPFDAAPTVRGSLENALRAIESKHQQRLEYERELVDDEESGDE